MQFQNFQQIMKNYTNYEQSETEDVNGTKEGVVMYVPIERQRQQKKQGRSDGYENADEDPNLKSLFPDQNKRWLSKSEIPNS